MGALFERASLFVVGVAAFTFAVAALCSGQDAAMAQDQAQKAAPASARLSVSGAAAIVSQYRARHGLPAVSIDSRLMAVARQQTRAMVAYDRLSHDVGGDFATRLRSAGYVAAAAGENLAAGQRTLAQAFAAWVNSPGHRSNLLLAGATRIGIAAMPAPRSRYGTYWTLVLAAPLVANVRMKGRLLRRTPVAPVTALPDGMEGIY